MKLINRILDAIGNAFLWFLKMMALVAYVMVLALCLYVLFHGMKFMADHLLPRKCPNCSAQLVCPNCTTNAPGLISNTKENCQ